MSQTTHLIEALKRCLRAKELTYRDVAAALELSESSVKRLFCEKSFSLQRFEQVCRFLGMTIYDVSRLAATRDDRRADRLTEKQEHALAGDPVLLTFFYLLLIGWKPGRIGKRLELNESERVLRLAQLDRLALIELLPRNRVRLLTDTHINWRTRGPVRSRYEARVKQDFFDVAFDQPDEKLCVEVGELSDASRKVILRRIEGLAQECAELAEIDRRLPQEQKRSFGVVIGARAWTYWDVIGERLARMRKTR